MIFTSRHAGPAAGEAFPVRGFVVVVSSHAGPHPKEWLTNSDLMDLETAEHEAAVWRRKAAEQGSERKFEVCPVIGGDQ